MWLVCESGERLACACSGRLSFVHATPSECLICAHGAPFPSKDRESPVRKPWPGFLTAIRKSYKPTF